MIRIHSFILFAAIASSAAAVTVDEVRIGSGALKGAISGGVVAFKGIPYAARDRAFQRAASDAHFVDGYRRGTRSNGRK